MNTLDSFIMLSLIADFLAFWVGSIRTYAKGSHPGFPKIVLIGTHRDQLPVRHTSVWKMQCLFFEPLHSDYETHLMLNTSITEIPGGSDFVPCFVLCYLYIYFKNCSHENRHAFCSDLSVTVVWKKMPWVYSVHFGPTPKILHPYSN